MEDKRIQKTKAAIKDAFESLVEDVEFEKITVSAIAGRANINRKTFYLHYDSVEDLLNSIAEDYSQIAMQKIVEQGLFDSETVDIDKVVQAIGESYREARLLNPMFMRKFPIKSIIKSSRPVWIRIIRLERERKGLSPLQNEEYYATYFLGGMLSAYEFWYNTPNDMQFDEIAKIIVTSALYGAEAILTK